MPLEIVSYQPEHEPLVAEFNERGRAHKAPFGLSRTPVAGWLPKREGAPVFREFFLALDGRNVRGGFTLRRQEFWLGGEILRAANYQGPLSEGIWDRRYMMAGVQMLKAALREEPLLYALGMGGLHQPLPKQLASAGWQLAPVPFFFHVPNPSVFLRQIQPLRRSRVRSAVMDFAVATGLGPAAVHAVQWIARRNRDGEGAACEPVSRFGDWADAIWEKSRAGCLFSAIRDAANQNTVFSEGNGKNIILRCTRDGRDLGWAVVRCTPMHDDKYFGSMRLGSIVDCCAVPGRENVVIALATGYLKQSGADLIVSNQSFRPWTAALRSNGYLSGPSNFIFASSPKLSERLGPLSSALPRIHINRADGDGPIHL